jgi:hypothetical protein
MVTWPIDPNAPVVKEYPKLGVRWIGDRFIKLFFYRKNPYPLWTSKKF